jgi:hypothetical protein
VVRVTTEEGQRIVGIKIPSDNLGAVLRSLGLGPNLREPDEIFYAVLDEGEEITLTSNLKLRRVSIHREPTIELCGVDPHKFAELRDLDLVNEQIRWKQRFFIPTDETNGIDILTTLLDRYPVIAKDDPSTEQAGAYEIAREVRPTKIVNLDEWFAPAAEAESTDESKPTIAQEPEPARRVDLGVDRAVAAQKEKKNARVRKERRFRISRRSDPNSRRMSTFVLLSCVFDQQTRCVSI